MATTSCWIHLHPHSTNTPKVQDQKCSCALPTAAPSRQRRHSRVHRFTPTTIDQLRFTCLKGLYPAPRTQPEALGN
jgi:hypothetical protein